MLEDNLGTWARSSSETLLRPIEGPTWATVSAPVCRCYVAKKNTVLVGFHERKSR